MALRVTTLAERPELAAGLWTMDNIWPEFMMHDPLADLFYPFCERLYADYVLVADDDTEPGRLVARGCSMPFTMSGDDLPDDGWDGVIRRGWLARERGVTPDRISALEITVRQDLLGRGLSGLMLAAMRDNAARLGFGELVAPVRPNRKHLEPLTPMAEYAFRTRDDGLPYDAWLRVHVRAGGRIVKVAPRSMTVSGTLAEWQGWRGTGFERSGTVTVDGALAPVHVDLDHDHAVYVEPNVWVAHPLTP
ncbi:N-acetyltransferase [Nonomuraea soli]|uniref:GNAT superfamily N-acetyltransferase n=1 Tax=Nonomuraea soli TaxID=1032476 RepID=A0A7W0CTV3_9ACTN|nr:N-acetyltransferase [Nonomuraea soli]MBA2897257.1 GNAT superfamily N-acetyltransferase [Nonomuraea soli]